MSATKQGGEGGDLEGVLRGLGSKTKGEAIEKSVSSSNIRPLAAPYPGPFPSAATCTQGPTACAYVRATCQNGTVREERKINRIMRNRREEREVEEHGEIGMDDGDMMKKTAMMSVISHSRRWPWDSRMVGWKRRWYR